MPEYVESFGDYRRKILGPMYAALDRLPHDASPIRHEFFNARGAVFKFSRKAMEVRVLDTQECVKMDAAIAAFVRAALKDLTKRVLAGKIVLPTPTGEKGKWKFYGPFTDQSVTAVAPFDPKSLSDQTVVATEGRLLLVNEE